MFAGSRGTRFVFPGIRTFLGLQAFLIPELCRLNFFLSGLSVLKRFISERNKQDHTRSGQQRSFLGLPVPDSGQYFAAAREPCALPRCAVPSPGKPCLSCTHHNQSFAPEAAGGAAGSLAAASNCCKIHLLTHQESPTKLIYEGCHSLPGCLPSPHHPAAEHPRVALSHSGC